MLIEKISCLLMFVFLQNKDIHEYKIILMFLIYVYVNVYFVSKKMCIFIFVNLNFVFKIILRLNLINHSVGFISCQFACNSALSNPVFRWKSCKGSV